MNKRAVIVLSVIIVLLVVCSLYFVLMNNSQGNSTAFVYVNNSLYMTIDLSEKKYIEYTVETEYGYNKIVVENASICVSESDCPDKTCVKTGKIKNSGRPIICIPHRLEIIIPVNNIDGFSA